MEAAASGKAMVLEAMNGKKPDRIPVFISAYWDYWTRAAGADPLEWVYGSSEQRLAIETAFVRRHEGAFIHRTAGLTRGPIIGQSLPADLPVPGQPPWTAYIEAYLPHMVVYDEAPDDFVISESDIDRVIRNDHRISTGENSDYLAAVVRELGSEVLTVPNGAGVFPHTRRCLGGIERTMFALMDNPGLVEAVMDALVEYKIQRLPLLAAAGAEAVWGGGYNEGADMFDPALWRQLVKPRHARLNAACHAAGLKVICWFLGDCMPLLEDLVEVGYDMLLLEQPRIGYRVDVGEIRRRVGLDLCFSGWIPELAMIDDDRETIARCIDEQVDAAGRDGAFVFSTSMLDSHVDPDTVDYFCERVTAAS